MLNMYLDINMYPEEGNVSSEEVFYISQNVKETYREQENVLESKESYIVILDIKKCVDKTRNSGSPFEFGLYPEVQTSTSLLFLRKETGDSRS